MKKYKAWKEPYKSKIEALLPLKLTTDNNGILLFSGELVYNIAKASGLRSKKTRHIVKRFRKIMKQPINELSERSLC